MAIAEEPDKVEENGYLLEMTRYDDVNKFDVDTASYAIKSDLSETESIKEEQISYISNYIQESYDALKNGDKDEVEQYIDLDSLVDIYIGNEIVKNVDAGWDSFYMYKDADGKLCFGPMWDFDLAMGNANCVKGFDSSAGFSPYHVLNVNANSNPWFCQALKSEWFRELVRDRWNELQNDLNDIPNIVINEAEANYQSYCRNFEKWDILGKQTNISPEEIVALPTYKDHYLYLSNWLAERVDWLTENINSEDFINGIFVKEDGKELSAESNLAELSSNLAFGCSGYEILPNTGISVSFEEFVEEWAQACVTGFMLEEGAEYVLSFDYSSNNEVTVPVAIQKNSAPWTPYYMEEIIITSEIQHFEGSFIAPNNDSNAALAFSLGGSALGTVVNLENMSLVKKSSEIPGTFKYGDVDGNGKVDSIDFGKLKMYLLRMLKTFEYEYAAEAADVNADGKLNSLDFGLIKKYLLGQISSFPAEEL
ncbi:MAG: Endoglucanase E precursor [Firmicutes bacterium ADurb.Bin419]|nr:MAG: Endoglucanase E precursor [Firmicutes bacterium ADurb.Bin419]